jgi:hypothetical protein
MLDYDGDGDVTYEELQIAVRDAAELHASLARSAGSTGRRSSALEGLLSSVAKALAKNQVCV